MGIFVHEKTGEFHLYNNEISYIMKVLRNGQLGQLYFGKRIAQKDNYDYMIENSYRPTSAYVFEGEYSFSLEHLKQEYPSYGTSDFRMPAVEILQKNGSRITNFTYVSSKVYAGKPKLASLPATYTEKDEEADTLEILLRDELLNVELTLYYTIFNEENAIARSARFENKGGEEMQLTTAMSLSLDLPDADYAWMQFSGYWGRERHLKERTLQPGITSINSTRGDSGHVHNPFVVLKRLSADEFQGEALGFSLVYSGNFLAQAEVDSFGVTRMMMGINPFGFSWCLKGGESFQTPEAVVVYSDNHRHGTDHEAVDPLAGGGSRGGNGVGSHEHGRKSQTAIKQLVGRREPCRRIDRRCRGMCYGTHSQGTGNHSHDNTPAGDASRYKNNSADEHTQRAGFAE